MRESLPPEELAASRERPSPASFPLPGRERHCALILLNSSPAPLAELTAETATSSESTASRQEVELPIDSSHEPPAVQEFRRLHREIPAEVKRAMQAYHLHNYSVHIAPIRDDYYAVRYFEYLGDDLVLDMASLERDPDYRRWSERCEACQLTMLPLSTEQWWAPLEEIGHVD